MTFGHTRQASRPSCENQRQDGRIPQSGSGSGVAGSCACATTLRAMRQAAPSHCAQRPSMHGLAKRKRASGGGPACAVTFSTNASSISSGGET